MIASQPAQPMQLLNSVEEITSCIDFVQLQGNYYGFIPSNLFKLSSVHTPVGRFLQKQAGSSCWSVLGFVLNPMLRVNKKKKKCGVQIYINHRYIDRKRFPTTDSFARHPRSYTRPLLWPRPDLTISDAPYELARMARRSMIHVPAPSHYRARSTEYHY